MSAVEFALKAVSSEMADIADIDFGDFQLIWRKIDYTVHNSDIYRIFQRLQGLINPPISKHILRSVSGNIKSGELVAFMGPSGAGKSTLLECVVDKRVEGKTGEVFVSGNDLKHIHTSFVAQKNVFHSEFTVKETILYAARLQLSTKAKEGTLEDLYDEEGNKINVSLGGLNYSRIATERVIKNLSLNICENNRVHNCSGGQQKRLAIAQELVAMPRILLLDEPTSGLDSTSSYQLIELLLGLSQIKPKIAVLATIHQPSYKLLQLFHKLYVISLNGECIYENRPERLTYFFTEHNLECPPNFNPVDFLIEVAYGQHGMQVVDDLAKEHRSFYQKTFMLPANTVPLNTLKSGRKYPIFSHLRILMERDNIRTIRDPMSFGFRFLTTAFLPFFLATLFGMDVGARGGCPPHFDSDFEPSQLGPIRDEIKEELETTFHNSGNMFFAAQFVMFNTAIPTLMTFPVEMIVFKSEKSNFWYGLPAFYFAKTIGGLPLHVLFISILWPSLRYLQSQIWSWWRFRCIFIFMFLQLLISEAVGNIIGAVCMYNIPASMFLGPALIIVPMGLLCGFFIKVKSVSIIFNFLSYFSYMRFALEGILVSLYGFGRCSDAGNSLAEGKEAFVVWMSAMLGIYNDEETSTVAGNSTAANVTALGVPTEKFVTEIIDAMAGKFLNANNEVQSSVMIMFGFQDYYLERALKSAIIYLIVVKIIAYFVIGIKVKDQK